MERERSTIRKPNQNVTHSRLIRGPYRLINPLTPNRLTPRAVAFDLLGVSVPTAVRTRPYDWPSAAQPGVQSLRLSSWGAEQNTVAFDPISRVAVFPLEQITFSVYAKADVAISPRLGIEWFDRTGAVVAPNDFSTISVTTAWQRFGITRTAPAGAVTALVSVRGQTYTSPLQIAAPQVETGPSMTSWQLGGGSAVVLMDQLATTSPRFPLTDVSMTLLEA